MINRSKGLFGSVIEPRTAVDAPARAPFFGSGGVGRNIAGIFGDALLQMNGQRPAFQLARQQREAMDYQSQQAKTEREAENQQWYARQAWERANPAPQEPTALQRNYEYLGTIDRGVAADYLAAQARDPADAFVTVNIPGRGTYAGPQSGLSAFAGGGGSGAPDRLPAGFDFGDSAPPGGGSLVSPADAARVRASMPAGPAGDRQFQSWVSANNIQIGSQ